MTKPRIAALDVGREHSMVLMSDGAVWTWGGNHCGQLGDGTLVDRCSPAPVKGLPNVVMIAAGGDTSIAYSEDGTLWMWGFHTTMSKDILEPHPIASDIANAKCLSAGFYHRAVLHSDGSAWVWGTHHILANPPYSRRVWGSIEPVRVPGLPEDIISVYAGGKHAIALTGSGEVWTWGDNYRGQRGDGNPRHTQNLPPARVESLPPIVAISAKSTFNLALCEEGNVWGWGTYQSRVPRLRDAPIIIPAPELIYTMGGVRDIVVGVTHNLIIRDDGTLVAWGDNYYGQLGIGSKDRSAPLTQIPSLMSVEKARANMHNLALLEDGTLWAWGQNDQGQLGDGTTVDRNSPVQVIGL